LSHIKDISNLKFRTIVATIFFFLMQNVLL